MESSLQAAREDLNAVIELLKEVVPKASLNDPITLDAVTPYTQTLQTSFGREVR